MRKRRRVPPPPSSSHHLVELALNSRRGGCRNLRKAMEGRRETIAALAGVAGPEWAIDQLSSLPTKVWPGWSKRFGKAASR
jgi:hypothetical protein